jgi:hypothetical protein
MHMILMQLRFEALISLYLLVLTGWSCYTSLRLEVSVAACLIHCEFLLQRRRTELDPKIL